MISVKIGENEIHVGDTIRVHSQVTEGERIRVQIYEGLILRLRGRGENKTMTVRRIGAGGVGVERTWPINAKSLVKVEVLKKMRKIRRSKLYFLRKSNGHSH